MRSPNKRPQKPAVPSPPGVTVDNLIIDQILSPTRLRSLTLPFDQATSTLHKRGYHRHLRLSEIGALARKFQLKEFNPEQEGLFKWMWARSESIPEWTDTSGYVDLSKGLLVISESVKGYRWLRNQATGEMEWSLPSRLPLPPCFTFSLSDRLHGRLSERMGWSGGSFSGYFGPEGVGNDFLEYLSLNQPLLSQLSDSGFYFNMDIHTIQQSKGKRDLKPVVTSFGYMVKSAGDIRTALSRGVFDYSSV